MSKPTESEMEQALAVAGKMRETGNDPDFLAKTLLNCHYQSTYLYQVLHAAEHYIRSGHAEREHSMLVKAIDKAHQVDERSAKTEHQDFGLS